MVLELSPASDRRAACCTASVHLAEAGAEAAGRVELVARLSNPPSRPACLLAACCPLLTATALVAVPVLQRTLSGIAVTSVRRGRGSGQYLRRKHFGETKIAGACTDAVAPKTSAESDAGAATGCLG